MLTTAYDAMLRRCPKALVGVPERDIFGQIMPPALSYIASTQGAHSYTAMRIRAMGWPQCYKEGRDEGLTLTAVKGIVRQVLEIDL